VGSYFMTENAANTVMISREVAPGQTLESACPPEKAQADRLDCIAPMENTAGPGRYKLKVIVGSSVSSNQIDIDLVRPPGPPTQLRSIEPNRHCPGQKVVIDATGIAQHALLWWRSASADASSAVVRVRVGGAGGVREKVLIADWRPRQMMA